jgi:hypothetical protein
VARALAEYGFLPSISCVSADSLRICLRPTDFIPDRKELNHTTDGSSIEMTVCLSSKYLMTDGLHTASGAATPKLSSNVTETNCGTSGSLEAAAAK